MALDARRRDQRERLLRSATEVFARQGYANAGVEEIVGGARVSRTAFYQFFANKEQCLLAVCQLGFQSLTEALADVVRKPLAPRERVRAEVRALVATLAADPAMARVLLIESVGATPMLESGRAEARQAFASVIEAQLHDYDHWRNRSARDREIVSLASMAAIAELISHLVATNRLDEWQDVVDPVADYVTRGLMPD
jgi:AcrR family transcriptional regulator